jgi:hypothetical protein
MIRLVTVHVHELACDTLCLQGSPPNFRVFAYELSCTGRPYCFRRGRYHEGERDTKWRLCSMIVALNERLVKLPQEI